VLGDHLLGIFAYLFDCTFFRLICLTAKALRRITMRGFLVGATEPDKSAGQPICTAIGRPKGVWYKDVPDVKRTLKQVQLRILGCSFALMMGLG